MIERLGKRSWEELTQLLESGYFFFGGQRIVKVHPEGHTFAHYMLWDNYEQKTYHAGGSTLSALVTMEHIPLEEWSWYHESQV